MLRPAQPSLIQPRNRPGVALAAAIFGIVIVSLITAGAWTITELDNKATTNRVDAANALRLAHTAETHALSVLRNRLNNQTFTRLILGSDNLPLTADDGLLTGYTLGDSLSIPSTGRNVSGVGRYFVRITDDPRETDGLPLVDSNRRLLLTCRGVTNSGASATVNVIVMNFTLPAITVDGNIEISSLPRVLGACGGIHANGNISGGGKPTVSTQVTATGSVSVTVVGGTKQSGAPAIDVPNLNPADFCGSAGYTRIFSGSPPNQSYIWRPSSLANNTTYCVTGNVEFDADIGSPTSPVNATIIATGSIKLGGKKVWMRSTHPDGIVLMAGGDLDFQGEAGFYGLIYAGAQCYISGKPYVNGAFICKNRSILPTGAQNWVSQTQGLLISGDADFTFDCNSMLSGQFNVVAWYPTIGS